MGALTDNRKRCFVDLCAHFSSSAVSIHLQSELSPGAPPKKPKVTPPLRSAAERTPLRRQSPAQAGPRSLPPPAPLRRPVHGPQRIVRVFGHRASSGSCSRASPEFVGRKEGVPGMGNLISWSINRAPFDALWSSRRKGKASVEYGSEQRFKDENLEGLDLDEYKRLVEGAQEGRSVASPERRPSETASAKIALPRSVSSAVSDLTILTREEDELPKPHVLKRKVEDARRLVKVESNSLKEDLVETSRTPLYKDLLLSARKHDSRLSSLDFEVKLTEKKISEFHKVVEVKPEKDLHGPFAPLTDDEENDVNLALRDPDKFRLRKHEVLALHESSNIEITREVIQCLRPGAWLNDEVINLYFELLKERERREPKKFLKCHFFNTFFYKKARYFVDEVKDKSNKTIDIMSWNLEQVNSLPLQKNGWDCGMFMLKYADFYSRNLSLCFQQDNMIYFRKRTAKEILSLRAE